MLFTSTIHGDRHILSLTGLRAVGALLVVIYHFHKMKDTAFAPLVEAGGVAGLLIFFALSGYILTHVHHREFAGGGVGIWARFLWKRIARIYPLHVFLLFVFLLFYPAFGNPAANSPRDLFLNLTLTHGWYADHFSFIQASWSISVEFFYYLLFPALLLLRYGKSATIAFISLALLYGCFRGGFIAIPEILKPVLSHRIFYYGSFFVLGVAVFYMTERHERLRRLLDKDVAFYVLSAATIAAGMAGQYMLAIFAFTIPLLIRSAHTAPVSRILLGNPVMLLIGELSYSLYLSHQFIHSLVMRIAQGMPIAPLYMWGSVYLLLIVWCLACYWLIEIPARTKLRALLPRKFGKNSPPATLHTLS